MDITIVIPVLNRKALLRRTLESIKRSPLGTVPVIVADNGSSDGTLEFLSEYVQSNPHVRFVEEPVRSAAAARNRGLSMATTTWVYFFDSDDEFEDIPHSWNQDNDLICFPTRQKRENKIKVRSYIPTADPAVQITNSMLNTISMIFRTSWLKSIGGWNADCKVWDDWELGTRALIAAPKMQWITEKAYHTVNIHTDSITGPSFKSRYKHQLNTISHVINSIQTCAPQVRERCTRAIVYRICILRGKLLYEGDKKAAAECSRFLKEEFNARPTGIVLGKILEFYTSLGGPGAWRLALNDIKKKKK